MTPAARRAARAVCLALSLVAAGLWLGAGLAGVAGGAWLVAKAVAMPLVAAFVALAERPVPGNGAIVLALALHGAGDLLLELALLAGVAAFLAGHLLYLSAFWRRRRPLDDVGGGTKLAVGALALVAALFLAILAPGLRGTLRLAVPIYVAALVAMAAAAWWCGRGRPWVPLGASLFVASDALLGLELFAGGAPGGRALVWPLYVAGQTAIAVGWSGAIRGDGVGARSAAGPFRE